MVEGGECIELDRRAGETEDLAVVSMYGPARMVTGLDLRGCATGLA